MRCRADRVEPPGRIDRFVTAAQTRAEKSFCTRPPNAWAMRAGPGW
ncbi:hypothetical protein ABZ078_10745 [Streptomyces sp. NPDC006385]